MTNLRELPASWNDSFADKALEYFEEYLKGLPYPAYSSIGLALEKLKILEKQGAEVDGLKLLDID